MDINCLEIWLKTQISQALPKGLERIIIFGSVCREVQDPSDVDVLVIVSPEYSEQLAGASELLRIRFRRKFELPLHLTRLTSQEAIQHEEFISQLIKGDISIQIQ